jgi:hypothetical protein
MFCRVSICAIALCLFVAALLSCIAANAQSSLLGKQCDLAVFGEKDTAKFLAFDQELRAALEANDIGKLALLVQFPMRIDDERGAYFIHDPASLQGRYQEIFPPAIRDAVLQSTRDSIWCNYTGIAYGEDKIWINATDRGYYLMTINMPSALKNDPSLYPRVEMACSTSKHRILIDVAKNGEAHYRGWNEGHLLTGKPDLELYKGEKRFEGTGPCSHELWTFKSPSAEYEVESAEGCYSDSDAPPRNAKAQLSVSVQGKSTQAWCF